MKKFISLTFLTLAMLVLAQPAHADKKADKDTQGFRYDIEYVKSSGDGMVAVKVASYAKKAAVAQNQCAKNAVHGVIFKGFAGAGASQSALAKDPGAEANHPDFFKMFFAEGGEYMKYVTKVDTGSAEFVKVGKEYKVSQVVYVNKAALRKALEAAGIIRGLSTGF